MQYVSGEHILVTMDPHELPLAPPTTSAAHSNEGTDMVRVLMAHGSAMATGDVWAAVAVVGWRSQVLELREHPQGCGNGSPQAITASISASQQRTGELSFGGSAQKRARGMQGAAE